IADVERVDTRVRVVAEAIEPDRVTRLAMAGRVAVRGDVELGPVPQAVGVAVRSCVDRRARVDPVPRRDVEPVDRERLSARAPEVPPPGTVVPPQLALGLR